MNRGFGEYTYCPLLAQVTENWRAVHGQEYPPVRPPSSGGLDLIHAISQVVEDHHGEFLDPALLYSYLYEQYGSHWDRATMKDYLKAMMRTGLVRVQVWQLSSAGR